MYVCVYMGVYVDRNKVLGRKMRAMAGGLLSKVNGTSLLSLPDHTKYNYR